MSILIEFLWVMLPAPAVTRKQVTLKEEEFSLVRLTKRARRIVKDSSEPFVQVTFLAPGAGAPLPKPSHYDFDQWRRMYELSVGQQRRVAEAISINGNAILRIHEPDGSVRKQVLFGEDPTILKMGGVECEIVYFGFSEPNRLGLQESVFVFVRSRQSVGLRTGAEVLEKLEQVFRGIGVTLVLRSDAWFIYQQRYPFFNPFNEDRDIPPRGDYESLPSVVCTRTQAGPRCEISYP